MTKNSFLAEVTFNNWYQQNQHLFLLQLILKQDIMKYGIKDSRQSSPSAFNISKTTPGGPLSFLIFILFIAHCTSTSILHTVPIT